MIEVGDVYFLKTQETLVEQLTQYPDVEHDDEMDAFVFALTKAQDCLEHGGGGGGGVELF